jgi:F-type H+-transporting ATPase subunit delta
MAELTIEMTYGSALYQAAQELGKEKQILEESQALIGVLKDSPDLQSLLDNPTVSPKEKKEVVQKIFEGRICDELLNLLYVLLDKRRARNFSNIIKTYKILIDKEQGVSYGKIFSVHPLSAARLKEFEEETSKLLRTRVSLENETDHSLIGGVKIFVEGKVLDASLRTRLLDLGETIK